MNEMRASENADKYLALNKYVVDESNAHIELVDDPEDKEFQKLMLLCPALLYRYGEGESKMFDYAGCLECGTCRIACGNSIVKKWDYPRSTMGIEYRYG